IRSYRDLPKMLYHIQWQFRDEVRPRFGVMRGREFLMKDNYSFDLDFESARLSYNKMFVSYLRTFARLGLKAVPMEAESGPIGGNLSHEFLILADTGESSVWCDRDCVEFDMLARAVDYEDPDAVGAVVEEFTRPYARTDEKHDPAAFEAEVPAERRYVGRGIEVGHIFYFGAKYSEPLGASVTTAGGEEVPVHMGSYGVGVSRLAGAVIEANHDDQGIVWPESVAPYGVGIVNLRQGDARCDGACEDLYAKLVHREPLYDDRPERAGVKFADMDLIGLPWQVIVGPRGLDKGSVELKCRATGERQEISLESALARLA
ncbi:MAG: proline--tRNA ligase, partial [Alphaproteobacteria bacterium]|nr:proline--tRNA ligase [Alphaproteobacteria bacterium]